MNECPDSVGRLAISEEMTVYFAAQQKEQLLDALDAMQHLELDLAAVARIDTAGLQLLLLTKRESIRQEKRLSISGHSPAVQQILDFCNLAGVFGDPMLIPANS